MTPRPEMLIERWLPVDVIGAESMRERGASSALPPLYFLHVWWARRPLTASRAAILASVLPAWQPHWPEPLRRRFPNEEAYRAWFAELCGVFGDPVAGRKLIAWAKDKNVKLKRGPYSHRRAFTVSPSNENLELMRTLLELSWGTRDLAVLDAFAGGGSIPFEALRYGFRAVANELNPVASVILKATLAYPLAHGISLADDVRRFGRVLSERVKVRLERYFPLERGESVHAFIWARTVACPYTGKPIPLSPNWWLRKGTEPVAIRPVFDSALQSPTFEIAVGKGECAATRPDQGTVKAGHAVSPWAGSQAVHGDHIKAEAQSKRMGRVLAAVAVKRAGGLTFRAPTDADRAAAEDAERALAEHLPQWIATGVVPNEALSDVSNYDRGHRLYGIESWQEMFSPRQLLALGTFLEELRALRSEINASLPGPRAEAVFTLLGLALDKAADYNAILATWENSRQVVKHVFKRHDFSFSWSFAEFDAARNLFPWVIEQVADAYHGIAALAAPAPDAFAQARQATVDIMRGSASNMAALPSKSVHVVCVDPPYYDNVMYAECADFFYVWMKRALGDVHPQFFLDELTNKDDEAVANFARFTALGAKKVSSAMADYERKMAGAFREMHRVLTDDGVLTVMFTHKKVEAWDTLATSLIGAGFAIHASWPVHTESEHSLHQAKKNAAQSTILLSCRKREQRSEPVWWDDLKGRIRQVAREKAAEFEAQGLRGVDLYIATFGPTLSILSEHWPVLTSDVDDRTGEPKPLRPEVALELARQEVVNLRKQGLLLGRAVQFDPYTDWYLMAWDAFRAEEFPADEARKLAIALGLDLERQVIAEKRLVAKKTSSVVLQKAEARRGTARVDADRQAFDHVIDAVHTAMWVFEEDGAAACETFLRRTGLRTDATFKACMQAMLNAIPRTKQKGRFVRPEAEVLEGMRLAFFDDLTVPVEEEVKLVEEQLHLLGSSGAVGEEEPEEDEGSDEEEEE